jgi:hypothetical protein
MSAPSAGEVTAETGALPGERAVKRVLGASVVVMIAFWTAWYGHRSLVASGTSQSYYDFENAFPLADLWLGAACVLALVTLVRRHPSALLWLIATGAAGLYLGSMDLLYDLEHGIFGKGGGGAFEALIVAVTWIFSVTVLRFAWSRRGQLLGSDSGTSAPAP